MYYITLRTLSKLNISQNILTKSHYACYNEVGDNMYGINLNENIKYLSASILLFHKNEYHVKRKCDFDVLLLVFDGVLRFSEDGVAYEVHPGEYHIQKHDSLQDCTGPCDSPKYLYIHFNAEWTNESLLPKRGKFDYEYLKDDIEQMHLLSYGNAPYILKAARFYRILSKLCKSNGAGSLAHEISEFIIENSQQNITIDTLSERFSFSKNHIINVFKRAYGMTPNVYLNMVRLKKAKELLSVTADSLESISMSCGYHSYSHFYRQFIRKNNISPEEYRKQKRHK